MNDTQPSLFRTDAYGDVAPVAPPEEQSENIARVRSRIAGLVVAFWRERLAGKRQFHMDELREYVGAAVGKIAPDSPGRIMRDLCQDGVINYRVVMRSESLYEAMELTACHG